MRKPQRLWRKLESIPAEVKLLSKRRSKEKYFIAQVAASEKATAQTYFLIKMGVIRKNILEI